MRIQIDRNRANILFDKIFHEIIRRKAMLEKLYFDGTRKRRKIKSQYKGVEMAEISVQYGNIESLLEGRGDDDLERRRQKKAIKPRPSSKKLKVWHGDSGSVETLTPDGFYSSDFALSNAFDDDTSTYFMSKRAESVNEQGIMLEIISHSQKVFIALKTAWYLIPDPHKPPHYNPFYPF